MTNKPMKQKKEMRNIQKGCMVACVLGCHFFLHLSPPHPADGYRSGGSPQWKVPLLILMQWKLNRATVPSYSSIQDVATVSDMMALKFFISAAITSNQIL